MVNEDENGGSYRNQWMATTKSGDGPWAGIAPIYHHHLLLPLFCNAPSGYKFDRLLAV